MTGPRWLAQLNPAQREAAEHIDGPILVLAGAGSGKTRVLTTRIAHLIETHGVPPERIFAVTFTNRAALEMKVRIGGFLERDPTGLWIGTFHSLSARLLRREADRIGFSRGFTIYDEDDRLRLIKRLMESRGHNTKLFPPKSVQHVISSAKNRMATATDLLAAAPDDRLAAICADVMTAMGPALRAANAMDFDDLMLHPLELFRAHPDRLEAWRHRFRFLLVDEFQDTNRAQYELIRLLGRDHRNVFAVGDDDQAIYGWRGAEIRNMRDFERDFAPTRLVRLEENYRSTRVVLEAANAAIAENQGRFGKTLRTTRQGGESVTLVASADERDEAEWLAGECARRVKAGDYGAREIAVLYRTNGQSRALEEAFRRVGLPYRIVGSVSFYDRKEVKDLLAYLRLIANPADDEAFLRAIQVPRRGIGEASLATLTDTARQWDRPLLECAAIADRVSGLRPNVRAALQGFAEVPGRLRPRMTEADPATLLEAVITAIDYESYLSGEGSEGLDRWENVRELIAAAASWSEVVEDPETESTPLEQFLAEAALLSANDKDAGAEDGVTLMTLHTAKGLEWPVVAITGLEDGLFPLARTMETLEGLEEERRLFYVGLTRAKDKLYLTWARSRRRGGELKPGMASRFLRAIPPDLIEERRTNSMWAPPPLAAGSRRAGAWAGGGVRSGWPARADRHAAGQGLREGLPRGSRELAGREQGGGPEEANQDAPRYVKGERVRHRRFGSGTIQGLQGVGRDLKVQVAFDDAEVGLKQLLVAYAGLQRDWDEASGA